MLLASYSYFIIENLDLFYLCLIFSITLANNVPIADKQNANKLNIVTSIKQSAIKIITFKKNNNRQTNEQ